jgi:hypothetical protein
MGSRELRVGPKLAKFPDNFPVSREFDGGDGFEYDCVRSHTTVHNCLQSSASVRRALKRQQKYFHLSPLLFASDPLKPENLTVFMTVYPGYTAAPLDARYRHAFD